MTLGEYPEGVPKPWRIPPRVFDGDSGGIQRFRDVAPAAGVAAVGLAGGSAVEDFDGDGLLDIAVSSWGLRDPLRYFHNEGDGTFTEATTAAGLDGQIGGINLEQADYDNDGDVDLLVLRGAWMGEEGRMPNSLLRNNGDGSFADVTRRAGLFSLHPTHAAAFADYDNDGWLDLFVGNESRQAAPSMPVVSQPRGRPFCRCGPRSRRRSRGLCEGRCLGRYRQRRFDRPIRISVLPRKRSLPQPWRHTRGLALCGNGRRTGAERELSHLFWDYDNDGWLDLFAGGYNMDDLGDMARAYLGEEFAADHARVYRNDGDGTFAEVTESLGSFGQVILAMGANYGDLDSDGFPDCYVGTGIPDLRSLTPNRMLLNDGGARFLDVTTTGGFGNVQKGHGVSFADFDNDGDQDVFEVMGGAFEGDLYQNVLYENPGHGNRWLRLFPQGVQSNRGAIGGRVRVRVQRPDGSTRDIHHLIGSGGSFGSNPLAPHLGLGDATELEFVEITWPATHQAQRWQDLTLDRAYRLREGHPSATEVALPKFHFAAGHKGH